MGCCLKVFSQPLQPFFRDLTFNLLFTLIANPKFSKHTITTKMYNTSRAELIQSATPLDLENATTSILPTTSLQTPNNPQTQHFQLHLSHYPKSQNNSKGMQFQIIISQFRYIIFQNMEPAQQRSPITEFKVIGKEQTSDVQTSPQKTEREEEQLPSPSNFIYKKLMSRISEKEMLQFRSSQVIMDNFEKIMRNNRIWARTVTEEDPGFFESLVHIQTPEYLWIGCSDSRVPANEICGLKPGEVFVHRNIANQAPPSDINVLAVVQYSVQVLKVKDIIVTGHYGCGGIRASFKLHDHGPLQAWLSHIRQLRWKYKKNLVLPTEQQNVNLLCELNVRQQVYNIARIPVVQEAWKEGRDVRIHGLIYNLKDGLLKDLGLTLNKLEHIPKEFRILQ